jgi:hypothetical protein
MAGIHQQKMKMTELLRILGEEKTRMLDLRLLLCKHSRSGAHKRLTAALDAINLAIKDIENENRRNRNENNTNIQTHG